MSHQSCNLEKALPPQRRFNPRRLFCRSMILIENGSGDRLVASIHQARNFRHVNSSKALEPDQKDSWTPPANTCTSACQKRSASISACEGEGNSGAYAQVCWASISPVTANTTALHRLEPISTASRLMMGFRFLLRQHDRHFIQTAGTHITTIGTIHRNLSAATESFRPRPPDSTTSIFLLAMETSPTPRNVSGTSNNIIRKRTRAWDLAGSQR